MCCFLVSMSIDFMAQAFVLDVTQGNINPIKIAVMPFKTSSAKEEALAKKIHDQVVENLEGTGLFSVIKEKDYIEQPESMGDFPRFGDWRLLEAQGLVTGSLALETSGTITASFRLWDAFRETQMEGQAISGPEKSLRKIAHKISNYIYKRMIGEESHFNTKVAYVSESIPYSKKNKRRLAVMDFDGENHQYVTGNETIVLTPRLSPKKPELVFMSYETAVPQVFLLDLKTGKRKKLGDFPGMTFAPRFSPDGDKIIFSQSVKGLSSIYEMNLKTRKVRKLTKSSSIDTSPGYSPDGSKVVFNSDRSGTKQLYLMNEDGSDIRRISFGEGRYATPVWSPRGDLIAFTKTHKGNFYIGIMRPDGTGERWLSTGYVVEAPTWSPNGRLLMFTKQTKGDKKQPGGKSFVSMVDVTGRHEKILKVPYYGSAPDWSSPYTFGG